MALNQHCFSQPYWRVIAGGYQIESWFNDGQAVGTGGIAHPTPVHLYTGHYYYRFASSAASRESQMGGGWWIDYENYSKIRTFSERNDYSIRDAARLMLALPYAWTRVDLLIRVSLEQPMKAYAGEGKPAKGAQDGPDKGTTWIPTQHIKVCQLYIPGLYVKPEPSGAGQQHDVEPRAQLFESVFSWPGTISRL